MKLWEISGDGVVSGKFSWMSGIWVVILILLGGLGLALFLKELVRPRLELPLQVLCLWGFRSSWGWFVVSPAGLHGAEASNVSSSAISAFRAAIVRAVWSSKMPLANIPAILNLLDGPVGIDLAFHIVWARFRMMRRYLAYCPGEEPRIFRMLDLVSRGSQGHGAVHLFLLSAAELGFAWDGAEHGWVRGLSPFSQNDDGANSAFLFFCSGCLAFQCLC